MAVKVKMKMNRVQWELMSDLLHDTTAMCPIEDWNLESYIIADLYTKKMSFWSIFPFKRDNKVKVQFSMIQAIAINQFFGANSNDYNALIRLYIEPQLILGVHKLTDRI
jgi:hypothetical protein